ncbi:hypothetical protein RJ641_031438 [Dillenia turbinata]|uniref:Uncharacterized protein n=1 Tax=Dillenia turbinata TaxID=194707 RepID=A0AAN8VPK7_9MAGN
MIWLKVMDRAEAEVEIHGEEGIWQKIGTIKENHNASIAKASTKQNLCQEFFALSAHEALACHALPLAVADLSNLLNLCTEKAMPAKEVQDSMVSWLMGQMRKNKIMACKSFILPASAMVASEKQRQAALLEAEVKQAAELLDRAGKILMSSSTGPSTNTEHIAAIEPELLFVYIFNAYDFYGKITDLKLQQLLVGKNFSNSKACNREHLPIGLATSPGPWSNSGSPSPIYQKVALIIRKLITLTSIHKVNRDYALYGMFRQAYDHGGFAGEYPTEKGKWLAMTAWNHAALLVRLGKIDVEKRWMDIGLKLARHVAGTETYKPCM